VTEAARIAKARRDTAEAIRLADELRRRFPDNAAGYQIGAAAARELLQLDEAAAIIVEGTARFPTEAWPVTEAARIAKARGDTDEVARLAAALRRRFPDNAAGYQIGAAAARDRITRITGARERADVAIRLAAELRSRRLTCPLKNRTALRVAIDPIWSRINPFAKAFARSIADGGFEVYDYNYKTDLPENMDAIILHWPVLFFAEQSERKTLELNRILDAWQAAKRNRGLRLVWVAHDVRPPDTQAHRSSLTELFLATLDGIIYLSERSRGIIHETYGSSVPNELICVHGHYRDDQLSNPQPSPPIESGIRLGYFGLVRPYKGLEELIRSMGELVESPAHLTITGCGLDQAYAVEIEARAAGQPEIRLDLHSDLVPEAELEAAIDEVHGVVLPYRDILNSGSALLALSRNRPVLAPRLGSLPELQDQVGKSWLHLYDGPLKPEFLRSFVDRLHIALPEQCDLSAYDWAPIGQSLCRFIDRICADGE